MTPEEIAEVGQDIASALYARGREAYREALAEGLGSDFAGQVETLFRLAAQTALLRALRLAQLTRVEAGAAAPCPPVRVVDQIH